jgi:tryptophan 2,3-dioxygenase
MTERLIGGRAGTGDAAVVKILGETGGKEAAPGEYFSGVHYLKTTLTKRFFPLLWEARTFVER